MPPALRTAHRSPCSRWRPASNSSPTAGGRCPSERTATGTSPRADAEIESALSGWFHTGAAPHAEAVADLNLLAFALVRRHRPADAAPVFRRIGRHMTPYPWGLLPEPERTFLYWRDRT
ncbi:hypothetical protein RKD19_006358 [Streptomyces canus]